MNTHGFEAQIAVLRAQQSAAGVPCISTQNASFLTAQLRHAQPQNILEIGTCHGLSSCYLAHTAIAWRGQVSSLELSPLNYQHALKTLAVFNFSNLRTHNVDALDWLITYDGEPFDWIFIDAQKSKTLDFFLALQGKLSANAVVFVDDAVKYRGKMQTFYDYLYTQRIAFTVHAVDHDDGVLELRFPL